MRELNKVAVVWKNGYVFVVYKHNGKDYIIGGGNANSKKANGVWVGKETRKTLDKFGVQYED